MINRGLWKKPIVLQERSVSRTLGKKHQTKPPAFTESVGSSAPSLERVHVASFLRSIDRIFSPLASIAASREKDCPRKGKLSRRYVCTWLKTRGRGCIVLLRVTAAFFAGHTGRWAFCQEGDSFRDWLDSVSLVCLGDNRGYIEREARTRCEFNA